MAVNVLGRAYIEVHADTKPFGRELKESIPAITALAENKLNASGMNIGKKLSEGIEKGATKDAPRASRTIGEALSQGLGKILGRGGGGGFFSQFFSRNRASARKAANNLGNDVGKNFTSGMQSAAGDLTKSAFGGIGNLITTLGSSIAGVGGSPILSAAFIAAIPAIVGAVVALTSVLGPLVNVIGLLPGALGLAAAAIVPVVVGFQGFGAAVAAVLSNDPEKIAEAMKALSPSAARVAKELGKVAPVFRDIQKATQESLFKSLVTILPRVTEAIGPILKLGFTKVSSSFGNFFKNMLLLAENKQVQTFFTKMFELAAFTFDTLGGPIKLLTAALAGIASESAPTLEMIIGKFASMIADFAGFLQGSIEDDSFQKFLDGFVKAFDKLVELGKSGLNLIDSILGSPEVKASAEEFFNFLIDTINELADFFRSDVGKKSLQGMIDLAGVLVVVLESVILVVGVLAALFHDMLQTVKAIIINLAKAGLIENVTMTGIRKLPNRNEGGSPTGHATGGIFDSEHVARIAEGGRREVVIPMTDRNRAMELADRSGLTSMINNNDTVVNVYIGDEQIQARVDKRVAMGIKGLTGAMRYGPRPVGIGG